MKNTQVHALSVAVWAAQEKRDAFFVAGQRNEPAAIVAAKREDAIEALWALLTAAEDALGLRIETPLSEQPAQPILTIAGHDFDLASGNPLR